MAQFRVVWEIDVDAEDPEDAAFQAMMAQHDDSTANVFTVYSAGGDRRVTEIDLGDCSRRKILEHFGHVERVV